MDPNSPSFSDANAIANLIASTAHFGGNMLRFSEYPEPARISSPPEQAARPRRSPPSTCRRESRSSDG